MNIYVIKPRPFGADAIPKEVRYLVATARAGREGVFAIDCRPLSAYLRTAARHALAALKREGRISVFVPAERFGTEDTGAAYLLSREPSLANEPLLSQGGEGIVVVSLSEKKNARGNTPRAFYRCYSPFSSR